MEEYSAVRNSALVVGSGLTSSTCYTCGMENFIDSAPDVALLVSWLISLSLRNPDVQRALSQPLTEQMLHVGDTLELLRPETAPLPEERFRAGLPVQPFFWTLTIAMIDATNRQRRGLTR